MTQDHHTMREDQLPDTEFIRELKKLKDLRNNRHMDEPEFDERVEQLAADTYAHPTRDGWCCACDADIAFAAQYIQSEPEFKALVSAKLQELLEQKQEYNRSVPNPGWGNTSHDAVPTSAIQAMIEELSK